jgi:hypothetical protein
MHDPRPNDAQTLPQLAPKSTVEFLSKLNEPQVRPPRVLEGGMCVALLTAPPPPASFLTCWMAHVQKSHLQKRHQHSLPQGLADWDNRGTRKHLTTAVVCVRGWVLTL